MNDELKNFTTFPLVEEILSVTKKEIVTGRTRVRLTTSTHEEIVKKELQATDVVVDRIPINKYINIEDERPEIRTEGEITIIPVFEEVLIIDKKLLLKEEIHIRSLITNELHSLPITLRKQNVVVEQTPKSESPK